MNARKTIALFALFGLMLGGSATAAVNNMTSRGGFVPMGSKQAVSRSTASRGYAYRAPAARSTPTVAYSQPSVVAQAPPEGRRFSYAPSTDQQVGGPCAAANAPSTAADPNRRFSYEPAPASTVQSAPSTPVYSAPAHYSRGPSRSGRAAVELWQLPKTDPRKYGGR
jgi:hypothetical protein